MPQDHTQAAPVQQQSKPPVAPATQPAPVPLDPSLLRHVGGGADEGPVKGW
jgi:hypothetical protein